MADQLGVRLEVVDLAETGHVAAATLGIGEDRLRFGNPMARLRMVALFDRARRSGALVLGTSNKSEILLGYSTLFGDSAASVQVLGDVWKSHIFQLGRALGLPREVVDKPPDRRPVAGPDRCRRDGVRLLDSPTPCCTGTTRAA